MKLTPQQVAALRAQALKAIANHERRYKVKAPERLKQFYESDFTQYLLKIAEPTPLPSGYPKDAAFRLSLCPPTWINKDDDAINGPRGEWEAAKHFLPIFVSDQQLFVVVNLRSEKCAVGWYAEEGFQNDDGGYEDGVLITSKSLDEFLKGLKPSTTKKQLFKHESEIDEMDWSEDFDDDGARGFDAEG